jgi:hypothetical protein
MKQNKQRNIEITSEKTASAAEEEGNNRFEG